MHYNIALYLTHILQVPYEYLVEYQIKTKPHKKQYPPSKKDCIIIDFYIPILDQYIFVSRMKKETRERIDKIRRSIENNYLRGHSCYIIDEREYLKIEKKYNIDGWDYGRRKVISCKWCHRLFTDRHKGRIQTCSRECGRRLRMLQEKNIKMLGPGTT